MIKRYRILINIISMQKKIRKWIKLLKLLRANKNDIQKELIRLMSLKAIESYSSVVILINRKKFDSSNAVLRELYELHNKLIYSAQSADNCKRLICSDLRGDIELGSRLIEEGHYNEDKIEILKKGIEQRTKELNGLGNHKKIKIYQIAEEIDQILNHRPVYAKFSDSSHSSQRALSAYSDAPSFKWNYKDFFMVKLSALEFMFDIVKFTFDVHSVKRNIKSEKVFNDILFESVKQLT